MILPKLKHKIRTFLTNGPRRGYHVIIPNILGLQVMRVIIFHLSWQFRCLFRKTAAPNDFAQILEQEGVVTITDFLPEPEYQQLLENYQNAPFFTPETSITGPKLIGLDCSTSQKILNPPLATPFIENDVLRDAIEWCAAKKNRMYPKIRLHHYYADEKDIGVREEAQTDTLHYDVPKNNFRCFYFLEKVDHKNAAFEYAHGTHTLNWARLKLEYLDSIHQARFRKGKSNSRAAEIDNKLLAEYGANPVPIESPGNTLVIFNTMGLHRRGRFSKPGTRKAIIIDFRSMDTPLNTFPFLNKFFNLPHQK